MSPELRAFRGKAATLSFDVVTGFIAMFIAVELAFALEQLIVPAGEEHRVSLMLAAAFAGTVLFAFLFLRIHHQVWRHMGWQDAVKVLRAGGLAVLCFVPMLLLADQFIVLPRTCGLIVIPLWLVMLFGGRILAIMRSTEAPLRLFRAHDPDAPNVLLVGRVSDVSRALRDATIVERVRALGIVSIDEPESGRAIQGVSLFGGIDQLGDVIDLMAARYGKVPAVGLIGSPGSPEAGRKLLAVAAEKNARLMALSPRNKETPLVRLDPVALLGRPVRRLEDARVRMAVQGARLLVTGAGGSIGGELVRACAAFSPAEIVLVESSEYNLYRIDTALADTWPGVPRRAVIADVRQAMRMQRLMEEVRPDIVIHAAALKHVPLVEGNPCEAVLTNVEGARITADAACKAGARRFVFISSDKAVSPTNTMGATKRLAERVLSRVARNCPGMAIAMVRFGNVLGSSGSVVPRFEAQIASGGPVTVTHPETTRYFMTIREAAQLVLQAGVMAEANGEASLFMLDMGEPVRVLDLAETMIRLNGMEPYRDIDIVFTGQRAGDRLHESLLRPVEGVTRTAVKGVNRVNGVSGEDDFDPKSLTALMQAAREHTPFETCALLERLVPGYEAEHREEG